MDTVSACHGTLVYLVGSREAALALEPSFVPVDSAIVGIVTNPSSSTQISVHGTLVEQMSLSRVGNRSSRVHGPYGPDGDAIAASTGASARASADGGNGVA